MQTTVIAMADLSVRPSVTFVFCPDEWRYDRVIFSVL